MKYEDGLRSLVIVKQLALRLHHTSNFSWIHVLTTLPLIVDAVLVFWLLFFCFLEESESLFVSFQLDGRHDSTW